MNSIAALLALLCTFVALGACGDDGNDDDASPTTTAVTTSTTAVAASTTVVGLEQPAIWPAPDVHFATPEAAAKDFVSKVLGVTPTIGEFQQGDSRSGEIKVYSPGEGGNAQRVERGLLLLRQLGPRSGWFITSAVNENASITTPDARATVNDGGVTVTGKARGFEGSVVVRGLLAGTTTQLGEVITQGGSMATPEPYSVSLNLSKASPGDTVMILVRGAVGLEVDPGDFGAIPVVIG